ncbi:hypothetical protein RchiOBHm_Chr7g0223091 [Rosa chinensis]|uniref:Uncharacterized protein n=1 Tax=Rosa chinensis TaxID=74649 RepID=A0A2P6PDG5_ROSCH|nr:hypothetical protein RchiOBHm_Chr7g0223091 [Rosa chinensis]
MALDIREQVKLDDVMEEVGLGPNEGLEDYLDDDYLVFDCPGMHKSIRVPLSVSIIMHQLLKG